MPAKVSRLFICPRCNSASSAEVRPKFCPRCRYVFKGPYEKLAKEFSWEKLPEAQYFEIVQQEVDRLLDAPLEDLLGPKAKAIPEEVTIHRKQKVDKIKREWALKKDIFYRDASLEVVDAIMKVVIHLMECALFSADIAKIRRMVELAKKIGRQSEGLETFLTKVGKLIPPDSK